MRGARPPQRCNTPSVSLLGKDANALYIQQANIGSWFEIGVMAAVSVAAFFDLRGSSSRTSHVIAPVTFVQHAEQSGTRACNFVQRGKKNENR